MADSTQVTTDTAPVAPVVTANAAPVGTYPVPQQPAVQVDPNAPPAWVPAKFWDAKEARVNVEAMAKSYANAQKLIGKRFTDYSPEDKSLMADLIRDDVEAHIRAEVAKEFEGKIPAPAQAPETYALPELPEGVELNPEHPALAPVSEAAKKHGLTQEAWNDILLAYLNGASAEQGAIDEALKAERAAIPNYEDREKKLVEQVKARTGSEALLSSIVTAEAFLELEKLIGLTRETPMPSPQVSITAPVSETDVRKLMADPEYYASTARGRELQKIVRDYYSRPRTA